MPSIAIITINWKQPKLTLDLVKSLSKINHSGFKYHLFVVDNHSPDNSLEIFKKSLSGNPLVTVISNPTNSGYAHGNNQAIKKALQKKYDYVLLLNNDVVVDPDFLKHLLDFSQKNPQVGAVSPKIYFAPGYEFHQDRYSKNEIGRVIWSVGSTIDWNNIIGGNYGIDEVDNGQFDRPRTDLPAVNGCCLLVPSAVFKKVGLISEDYFLYYEDIDFGEQILRSGYKLGYQPLSRIWHLNSASSSGSKSNLHDYFLTRNRLIFGFKFASIRTKLALIRESIRTLFKGSSWQKFGVIDFYLHRFQQGRWTT